MALTLRIEGIEQSFPAAAFQLHRKLGTPVKLTVFLQLHHGNSYRLNDLSDRILQSAAAMEVCWKDTALFPKVIIASAESTDNREPEVMLSGYYNRLPEKVFVPRRRILKADDLKQLLRDNFAEMITWEKAVGNHLSGVKFPDKKKTNHIQNGISDWEMLHQLINSYNHAAEVKDALILSGDAADTKYQLVWAQDSKYRELFLQKNRGIDKHPQNGLTPKLQFGRSKSKPLLLQEGNLQAMHVSYNMEHGDLQAAFWDSWREKSLPLYYNDHMVYELTDRVQNTGGNDFLEWNSFLHVLPDNQLLKLPGLPPAALWACNGKVTGRKPTSEWIEVTLDKFEAGSNELDVRISTPYSGKDQQGGLHLVPEMNSEVLVVKQPNWQSPVVLLGNIRNREARVKAPYWQLEDPLTWHFKDVSFTLNALKAEASEDLFFRSKNHTITSSEEITLKTKGVTAKMDNSEMHIQ
ncbi:MAG: hypothetical protein P0Y53_19260 [Candidatus Pseudobacter hemicellulosilyticus]|uniref:Uncharacterized protein n=1 Tax=Candidatus Pseudobacter hemicellulosilyticus TaxID=3121375 RepID=A0AAJ5WMF6_9BACT|nr:MAG: hypothetical protein P0Y53_19260 [Pseudobacter sp.]